MPPNLAATITGYAIGDTLSIAREVIDLPVGRTVTQAWMTVGSLQKIITSAPQAGIGQITDPGADGAASLLFEFTITDTGVTLAHERAAHFSIQVKFDNGEIATLEAGDFQLTRAGPPVS